MTSSLNVENRERHEPHSGPAWVERLDQRLSPERKSVIEPGEASFKLSLRSWTTPGRCRSTSPAGHPRFVEIRRKKLPEITSLPYNDPPFDCRKFGNIADCKDWVYRPLRFTPQSGIHWQLNLRHPSVDPQQFKCSASNPPSISPANNDVDPYQSKRFPGCEGSSVSLWKHLYKPGETRANLAWETTLRGLSDTRIETPCDCSRTPSRLRDSIIESDPKLNYMYSH